MPAAWEPDTHQAPVIFGGLNTTLENAEWHGSTPCAEITAVTSQGDSKSFVFILTLLI